MKKRDAFLVAGIFLILAVGIFVSADGLANSAMGNTMVGSDYGKAAMIQEIQCRINFNIGILSSMANLSANSSVSSSVNLHADVSELQGDLESVQGISNVTDARQFVQGHYSEDINHIMGDVKSWRGMKVGEISIDQRAMLVSSYAQLLNTYTQCEQTAYINLGQERLQDYQTQIAVFQNKTNNLAAKGFDVTALNQLLSDANTQIITPLQNALSSSNTSSSVKAAIMTYCLYDGCANGTNFHMDAKFDVTRLSIILSSLQNNSAAFNLSSSDLSQAQSYLTNAQNTLDAVGTSAYQQGQSQTIFGDIKNASKIIVQLMNQAMHMPIGGVK